MHDLSYFRANLDSIAGRLATRGFDLDLEEFRELDTRRRAAVTESEQLKAQRNSESAEISKLRKQGVDTAEQQLKVREIGDRITALDEQVKALDEEFRELLAGIPNLPHESVPVGRSEADNVEVRRWGQPPEFDFEPKAHWDLGPELGILDFERAAKITGARFAVYWGLGAKLERALINFMLDVHTREHGYTEVLPPFLVNSASLFGTGQLPKFAADLFKCEGDDFWLAPTAEVPVTNLFRDETLDAEPAADQAVRLHAVLPQRGRILRQGRARHHPPAPVPEGGTGQVHPAGTELRRTGEADRRRRGHPAAAGSALPHDGALHRRHGLLLRQDLRHRSLAAGPEQSTRRSPPARTSRHSRRGARGSGRNRRRARRSSSTR